MCVFKCSRELSFHLCCTLDATIITLYCPIRRMIYRDFYSRRRRCLSYRRSRYPSYGGRPSQYSAYPRQRRDTLKKSTYQRNAVSKGKARMAYRKPAQGGPMKNKTGDFKLSETLSTQKGKDKGAYMHFDFKMQPTQVFPLGNTTDSARLRMCDDSPSYGYHVHKTTLSEVGDLAVQISITDLGFLIAGICKNLFCFCPANAHHP